MRRLFLVLLLLACVPGCVAARGRFPSSGRQARRPHHAAPQWIVQAVRTGDGAIHLLARGADGVSRHYFVGSLNPPSGWWLPAGRTDGVLDVLLLAEGPLPPGVPLVGPAGPPPDAGLAELLGPTSYETVRFEGALVVHCRDGQARPIAELPLLEPAPFLRHPPAAVGTLERTLDRGAADPEGARRSGRSR